MIGLELTSNFAKTVLASPINASATTITLFPGAGALFPNPSGGNYFRILITDIATSNYNEIVLCTARSGDVLTVTRNAEGTLARSWLAGDIIENVMTAGAFSELRSQGLNSNTAIGALSLDSVTTGANNSAVGTSSLQSNTTGTGNSTLGYQSARYLSNGSTALTIVTNSTYIGSNTKASANNVTNETVIGYNAIGSGSNTVTIGGSAVTGTIIPYGNVAIGGNPSATVTLHLQKSITGGTSAQSIRFSGVIQSDVTVEGIGVLNRLSTQAAPFTLVDYEHFYASQGTIGAGSAVTNQRGFYAPSNLIGATNNFAFQGSIAEGTGRYNLYMNGTASNYLAGSLGIGGVPSADAKVEVAGTYPSSGAVSRVIRANGIIPSTTTATARLFGTESNTQAAVFNISNLQHFCALQSTMGAGSTVTNQYGFLTDTAFTGATNNYGFYGNIPAATGRYNLYMSGTASNYLAGSLGIGSTPINSATLDIRKNITGATNSYGVLSVAQIQSDVTANANIYQSQPSTQATAFTLPNLRHFYASQASIGATSAVTNQFGYQAELTLTGATNNYGFFGNIPAATGRYNLYMAGTADNYLGGALITAGLKATSSAAPTIASATTIAPTTQIAFISGTTAIATITAPSPISLGGGQITLIPTGIFTTTTAGNIALASTAVVGKALIMTYDATTTKWYPSY